MGVGSRRVLGQLLLGIVWQRGYELKGARGVGESVRGNEAVCACKKDVFERVGGLHFGGRRGNRRVLPMMIQYNLSRAKNGKDGSCKTVAR